MKIAIKNMVCPRCVMVVENILTAQGFASAHVSLGYADIPEEKLSQDDVRRIDERLREVGFEVIDNPDNSLVETIKLATIIHARSDLNAKMKLSAVLEEKCGQSYKALARLFSQAEGRTIENYYIAQRIEYVKELLDYGDLTLAEIAYRAGYSSVAYLSRQFSREVGLTISDYRAKSHSRKPLTEV